MMDRARLVLVLTAAVLALSACGNGPTSEPSRLDQTQAVSAQSPSSTISVGTETEVFPWPFLQWQPLRSLAPGSSVLVTGLLETHPNFGDRNDWALIESDGMSGWVPLTRLGITRADLSSVPLVPVPELLATLSADASIHSGPSAAHDITWRAREDERFLLLGVDPNPTWLAVVSADRGQRVRGWTHVTSVAQWTADVRVSLAPRMALGLWLVPADGSTPQTFLSDSAERVDRITPNRLLIEQDGATSTYDSNTDVLIAGGPPPAAPSPSGEFWASTAEQPDLSVAVTIRDTSGLVVNEFTIGRFPNQDSSDLVAWSPAADVLLSWDAFPRDGAASRIRLTEPSGPTITFDGNAPRWSASGDLWFVDSDRLVDSGPVVRRATGSGGLERLELTASRFALAPDERHIALQLDDGVTIVERGGTLLFDRPRARLPEDSWAPDSCALVIESDGSVQLINVGGWTGTVGQSHLAQGIAFAWHPNSRLLALALCSNVPLPLDDGTFRLGKASITLFDRETANLRFLTWSLTGVEMSWAPGGDAFALISKLGHP